MSVAMLVSSLKACNLVACVQYPAAQLDRLQGHHEDVLILNEDVCHASASISYAHRCHAFNCASVLDMYLCRASTSA
eukprot:1015738-Pelagomonas_calceolata.AAC.1